MQLRCRLPKRLSLCCLEKNGSSAAEMSCFVYFAMNSPPPPQDQAPAAAEAAAPVALPQAAAAAEAEAEAAAPPPPQAPPAADPHAYFRNLYPTFDASLARCGGFVDIALHFLGGLMTWQEVDTELAIRCPPPPPPPPPHAAQLGGGGAPPPPPPPSDDPLHHAAQLGGGGAPPPPPPSDDACPGLELPRGDGGVRELDVGACSPIHLWHLFLNASVNGGYLGKSVIHFLVHKHPDFAAAYPGGKFCKTNADANQLELQKQPFLAHCSDAGHLQEIQDFIMNKIPTLLSLRTKMRCINVPDRMSEAAVAARAAAAAAAAEPPKATLNDDLYARGVMFVKFSAYNAALSDLLTRYFGNEHSRLRSSQDTTGFRSSDLLKQMAEIFNNDQEFQEFVEADDTHQAVLPELLSSLIPSAPPAPGPITADQLLLIINWTRKTTTFLVSKYDRSGHLEFGVERLRDIYDNFCQGPNCPEPIDRPKVACFMFAALGIVFNQVSSLRCPHFIIYI